MSILNYALSGNLNNFLNKLDEVSKETGKSKTKLFFNFIHCFNMIGSGYSDYLNYKLYSRSKDEILEYATIKTQDKFYEIVSPSAYKEFFTIKSNFLNNFKKYIYRDSFYKGSKEELSSFLKNNDEIMYKPVNGLAGKDVKKILNSDIKDIDEFYNEITSQNILLEGYVKQHSDVNKFASKSVNTIRVMTFGYNNHSEILCAMMRFGNGVSNVDNFHQGGMAALVDIKTGKLIGNAYDKDNHEYEYHPFSNIKFDGYQIPNWNIVKETCLEAAKVSDKIHVVGWDVAVTENGCTFIEGNRRPGFDLVQVLCNRGRKDIMRKCLEQINKTENKNYKV